jgi:hypothetical protein
MGRCAAVSAPRGSRLKGWFRVRFVGLKDSSALDAPSRFALCWRPQWHCGRTDNRERDGTFHLRREYSRSPWVREAIEAVS